MPSFRERILEFPTGIDFDAKKDRREADVNVLNILYDIHEALKGIAGINTDEYIRALTQLCANPALIISRGLSNVLYTLDRYVDGFSDLPWDERFRKAVEVSGSDDQKVIIKSKGFSGSIPSIDPTVSIELPYVRGRYYSSDSNPFPDQYILNTQLQGQIAQRIGIFGDNGNWSTLSYAAGTEDENGVYAYGSSIYPGVTSVVRFAFPENKRRMSFQEMIVAGKTTPRIELEIPAGHFVQEKDFDRF